MFVVGGCGYGCLVELVNRVCDVDIPERIHESRHAVSVDLETGALEEPLEPLVGGGLASLVERERGVHVRPRSVVHVGQFLVIEVFDPREKRPNTLSAHVDTGLPKRPSQRVLGDRCPHTVEEQVRVDVLHTTDVRGDR